MIWDRNLEYRDNGTLCIGSIIRILAPRPVESFMNSTPLIATNEPTVMMKRPFSLNVVPINSQIGANNSSAFVYNRCRIVSSDGYTPQATTCSGMLCDKQRVDDWNGDERGCGCYSMQDRRSILVLQHDIEVEANDGGNELRIPMRMFSSSKFHVYTSHLTFLLTLAWHRFRY